MFTSITVLTTAILALTATAAPTNSTLLKRDQFTSTDGNNCWGRAKPGNNGEAEWAIHITGIDPTVYSSGKMTHELSNRDVGPIQFKDKPPSGPDGETWVHFYGSLAGTATEVRDSFQNSAGMVDPKCHYYGKSASDVINANIDAVSHYTRQN